MAKPSAKKASKCTAEDEEEGNFDKEASPVYRAACESCGRGYHGNRWDAHHILPGVVFTRVNEADKTGFIKDCLSVTEYDINASYSMCGLPKLTAFILYFQTTDMKFDASKEKTVTMKRWGKVAQYANQKGVKIAFPGNFPVHNPVNWGHTEYNNEIYTKLDSEVFDDLKESKDEQAHFDPVDLKRAITEVKDAAWDELVRRGSMEGMTGKFGIEANLRARYQKKNKNWWKPLCMTDVDEPASP